MFFPNQGLDLGIAYLPQMRVQRFLGFGCTTDGALSSAFSTISQELRAFLYDTQEALFFHTSVSIACYLLSAFYYLFLMSMELSNSYSVSLAVQLLFASYTSKA